MKSNSEASIEQLHSSHISKLTQSPTILFENMTRKNGPPNEDDVLNAPHHNKIDQSISTMSSEDKAYENAQDRTKARYLALYRRYRKKSRAYTANGRRQAEDIPSILYYKAL